MNKEKLRKIYHLMYKKLLEIQLNHEFEKTMEENRKFSYLGEDDDYFFAKMVSVIFESGIRAVVFKKYEPEIRKEFRDYDVKKVAQLSYKDIDRMLKNPKMFKNIEACIHNAKEIVEISKKYGRFFHFIIQLMNYGVPNLIEELKSRFKHLGLANSYAFLKYVGAEVVKPDINVRRIMFRLGLIDSDKPNPKTYKQIQEVGEAMAKAVNCRVIEVDYLFYIYGSGGVKCVPYQICGVKLRCDICELKPYCKREGETGDE